ncbi:MAG TPA: DctP family TRAP transporter solute-binding subunit [bacterium]|nr:DctP family TRAP transporter solute-binding subunit [bacterium]HPN30422.1 DctP family TRAP transporter solute-binding subunit [bacterium]
MKSLEKFIKYFTVVCVIYFFINPAFSETKYKNEFKLSVVVGPVGPWGESASKFAELVKQRTDGRVNIKPYFNGQLFAGKQTNEFLLVKQGAADFALGSTINWSTTIKELNLFSLPFFFPDYDSLDSVKNGKPGKMIFSAIKKKGAVPLVWFENGFRQLTNSKRNINSPQDLNNMKIRVVGSPIFIDIFKSLGANPVSLNWSESITAFQQNTVDGQENPVVSVLMPYKIWQFHKYLTLWNYVIDPQILIVNQNVWNKFSKQDKEIIIAAAVEVSVWQKKVLREDNSVDFTSKFMTENKMSVNLLTKNQIESFKNQTKPVYDKWIKIIGSDLVKSAESLMK